MEKEILACIDGKNIKYLHSGQISKFVFPMERKEAHEKKIHHLITRFFIISQTPNGEILYLVQKRGKNKKTFPEYFTESSSGHINWMRDLDLNKIKKEALRELEEEFGIPPNAVQRTLFSEINTEGLEIAYIFFGIVNYNISINPNPDELDVKFSRFYHKNELENLLENEKNIDYSKKTWGKILNMDVFSLFESQIEPLVNKKNSTALFIGRFQPLHHGHIYVIKTILRKYNKLKIGIGSSQISHELNDPFTKEERKAFIKAALKKRSISQDKYEIFDIPDIFNAKEWVNHVISIVGEFDSVYSNSDWVRALFSKKGIKIDKKITIFKKKFNGQNIRNLISKYDKKWKALIPKEVVELIEQFDGIDRIQSIYRKIDNS